MEITKIITKYSRKEKAITYEYEKDLSRRYREAKSNNFSFPEIKNVFDCITEILMYYHKTRRTMRRHIEHAIHLIKNASQETLCTDITSDKCPHKGLLSSAIRNIRDIRKENVIFRYGKQYCANNVYETPYNGVRYPYAYCIRVMVQALHVIYMIQMMDTTNSRKAGAYQEQYHYYLDYLLEKAPNVFLIPTMRNISIATAIQNRCLRIQPCRIRIGELWRDINQVRRIYQNNIWYAKQHKISLDTLHAIMRKDTRALSPLTPKDTRVVYKIVCENATPFTKYSIKNGYNNCYPRERIYEDKRDNRVILRFYEKGK
jgi:hypothetical protein